MTANVPAHVFQQCLRWNARRHSHRPAGEPFDSSRYGVEELDEPTAKAFTVAHHYSGTYPAARFRVGMFEQLPHRASRLVGVAVFSVPMTQTLVPKYLGVAPSLGAELGRLVLLDHIPGNAESWFLARAFRLLRKSLPLAGVVSFCDPVPRFDAAGRQIKRSHTGVIYRAHNAQYRGRTHPRTLLLMPNGLCASDRTLSKIRNEEPGIDYAMRQLRAAGAPPRHLGETPAEWLWRLRHKEGFFRAMRHPGNHAFCWQWRETAAARTGAAASAG